MPSPSWTPTLRAARASLLLHGVLGLFAPVLGAGAAFAAVAGGPVVGWGAMAALAGPYVLAPLLGYAALLSDNGGLPPDEPCLRSGTLAGRHWFEFASLAGRRLWTSDAAEAARVRKRPAALPEGTGFEMVLRQARGQRDRAHTLAAVRTARDVVLGITVAMVSTGVAVGGLETLFGSGAPDVEGALSAAALVGLFFWLPSVVAFQMAFWLLFGMVYLLWNRPWSPRGVDQVRWTGDVLHTPVGDLDLAEPGLGAELGYTAFGARLVLWTRTQRLTLHGDHGLLVALREAVRIRARAQGDSARTRMPSPLARAVDAAER